MGWEMGSSRNISPRVHLLPAPHSARGFVRPRSPKEESGAGDCLYSLPTRVGAGPGPALVCSQPLALFPWPRRPASALPPPLPSPLGLRLQAPPAPPPANVALGPGPDSDSATRPSRSPGSSEGETRRAPGPGPTSCEALDTWIIFVGGWVEGRVGVSLGLRAKGGGNVVEMGTHVFRATPRRAPCSPRGRWTGAGDQAVGFLLLSSPVSPSPSLSQSQLDSRYDHGHSPVVASGPEGERKAVSSSQQGEG